MLSLYPIATMSLYSLATVLLLQSPAHIHKELDARYKDLSAAMVSNNWKKFSDVMTEDFVVDRKGAAPMDKKKVVATFKQERSMMTKMVWARNIQKLSMKNGVAQVTVSGKVDGDIKAPDGKIHKLHLDSLSVDDWVQLHHVWKLRHTLVVKSDLKLDGKPMKMG